MLKSFLAMAVGGALFVAGFALAAQQKDTYKLIANLKARFEVPKPEGAGVGATGLGNPIVAASRRRGVSDRGRTG